MARGTCRICGGEVSESNDKGLLLALVHESPVECYVTPSQHVIPGFYPMAAKPCPGSPSLAQYLPGQREDTRTKANGFKAYPINPLFIQPVREAWAKMQLGEV